MSTELANYDADLERDRERHEAPTRWISGIDHAADGPTSLESIPETYALQSICDLIEGEFRDDLATAILGRDHGALANVMDSIRNRVTEKYEARR